MPTNECSEITFSLKTRAAQNTCKGRRENSVRVRGVRNIYKDFIHHVECSLRAAVCAAFLCKLYCLQNT